MRMPGTRRPGLRSASMLAVFALVLAACGNDADSSAESDDADDEQAAEDAAESGELEEVTIAVVGAAMQLTFAPYTSVPIHQGYFEEEGIEADVVTVPGSAEAVQAVQTGEADVAVLLSPPLFTAVEEGADVTAFYNHITRNFAIPHVPEDYEITEILDMEGTTVGVVSLGAGAIPLIRAMISSEGGDPESVDFVAVGAGADVVEVIRGGQIDVVGLWDAVFAVIEREGVELRPLSDPFFDNLGFQGPVIAQRDRLADTPDLFAGVGRAIAKATVFAQANPEAAVLAHWEVFPDTRPTGVDEDEAIQQALPGLESRLEVLDPVGQGWGDAPRDEVEEFMQVLIDGGMLDEDLDLDAVWDDSLVDQFSDFDEDAIRDEAAAATG
jgi:NitT/TauT family transport system substrate-binding protein